MQSTDNRRRLDRNHSIHLIYTYLTLAEDHVGQPVRVTDLRADPLTAHLPRLLGPAPGPGPLAWAQLSVHLTPLHQLGAHRPRPRLPAQADALRVLSQTPAPVRVSIHDELVLVISSPESAVCAASEELVPGHEGETGDAVLRRGLPALHTALPAAAFYTPDSNLTSHVIDIMISTC